MKLSSLIPILFSFIFSCQNQTKNATEASVEDTSVSVALTRESISAFNSCERLSGKVYTYLPAPGKELHLFTLKFDCVRDSLKGVIFGPFPLGEHGVAFYKTELKNLVVGDTSNVSFLIVPGNLYEERITLENYERLLQPSGVDRGEQFFTGKFLADTAIVLKCASEFYDCYSNDEMIFKVKR